MSRLSFSQQETLELKNKLGNDLADKIIGVLVNDVAGVDNTQPTSVAASNYSMTINGVQATCLTRSTVKKFWEETVALSPKHIHALQEEGIIHQRDLNNFDSKELILLLRVLKERRHHSLV